MTHEHQRILDLIKYCGKKGVKQAELAFVTGFHTRLIRHYVKELIEVYGVSIGSDNRGFFIPTTKEEIKGIRNNLLARAHSILYRVSKLDKTTDVANIMGQIELLQQ